MGDVLLWIGGIVLIIGIVLGIAGDKEKHQFAVWLTIIGVGFIIFGILLPRY